MQLPFSSWSEAFSRLGLRRRKVHRKQSRRSLRLELLEKRELLAADVVTFDSTLLSYGAGQDFGGTDQDTESTVTISEDFRTLQIDGDGWKKLDLSYTVTANTVLEFDFASNSEGEIHGIGFDNDDFVSADKLFRLYGTQDWGIGDFNTYPGSGLQHYKIRIGDYFTGDMQYLTFANDDDVSNPDAQSTFSNVFVYESPTVSLDIDSSTVNENGGIANFTVTRTGSTDEALAVDLILRDLAGDATLDEDYQFSDVSFVDNEGTLEAAVTIPTGQASVNFTLTGIDDELIEGDEAVGVSVASSDDYTPATDSGAEVTILDDDLPLISVENVTVSEGSLAGVGITISQAPAVDMYITWTATDITADSADYDGTGGTIFFTADTTTLIQYVAVATYQDGTLEPDEQFTVTAFDAVYNQSSGTVTISDIDESLWTTIDAPETVLIGDSFVVSGIASTNASYVELVVDSAAGTWTEGPVSLDPEGNWSISFDPSYSAALAGEVTFTAYAFTSIGHSPSAIATTQFVAFQADPSFTTITVDLTVAAPETVGVTPVTISQQIHHIRPNTDDDDGDNTVDLQDNNLVAGENDLVRTRVELNYSFKQLQDNGYQVVLRRNDAVLRVYGGNDKMKPAIVNNDSLVLIPANLNARSLVIYTEWAGQYAANATADLEVFVQKINADGTVTVSQAVRDTETFRPLRTDVVVIAFVGESQSVNQTTGMPEIVSKIRSAGYDVYLFDEDDVGEDKWIGANNVISDSPLKDVVPTFNQKPVNQWESMKAVKEAILKRNVSKVAIIGFSHGGGAAYMLSQEMAQDPDLQEKYQQGKYELIYTAYIDAVEKGSVASVKNSPVNSEYHYNLYQGLLGAQLGFLPGQFPVQGGPVIAAAESTAESTIVNDNVDKGGDGDAAKDFNYGLSLPGGAPFQGLERMHTNTFKVGIAETALIQDAVVTRLQNTIP